MSRRDYYEILSVERTIDEDGLKKAYRKIAFQYHPDRNPDDPEAEERFKEAAEAYEILRDPNKRARYDRFGHEGVSGGGSGFSSNDDIFSSFGDIFGDLFGFSSGSRSRGPRPSVGNDLRYNLNISFRQAAKGDEVNIKIPRMSTCPECKGNRCAAGSSPETCPQCQGSGQVRHNQGFFQISVPCNRCNGEGVIITNPCPKCKGRGQIQEFRELSVKIPAGVDSGNRLRVRGEGEAGKNGGPNGDLYVFIKVDDDKTFERQDQDLIYTTEITMVQAAIGKRIEVPTLDSPVPMEIPAGTQSGEVFRLDGLGLPNPNNPKIVGDLLVEVKVLTPKRLSKRQQELLEEFEALEEERPINKAKNIFKKVGKAMGLDD
ncbi:molecular chaperone DnaJ [Desulfovibrio litoralis]|uniref:Chaperone protein DnaJ n=1 Tax=Desulfovibrio litoralis DSM 11393 TaxID=1121455 RepID=A0A1M7RTJ2_9BACT|nr:molecular chaperone DnaJ [Desulfovibrio litoralis]SHN49605.1 molecular chaperone DnaJ [Desulfovibrio litoralis DSM 11393]